MISKLKGIYERRMRINNYRLQKILKEYPNNAVIVDIQIDENYQYMIIIIEYEEWVENTIEIDHTRGIVKIEHLNTIRVTREIKGF